MNPSIWIAMQPILAQGARDVLRTVGMFLATHGLITTGPTGVEAFVGAGMTLAGLIWGWWTTSGYLQVAALLKKLTAAHTTSHAVTLAQALPAADATKVSAAVGKALIVFLMLGVAAGSLSDHAFAQSKAKVAATSTAKLTAAQVQANPLALIQQFSVNDLQAALADANAQTPPDAAAAACYTALLTVVQSKVANPLPAGPGIFQALQKARDAKAMLANLASPTGPLSALSNACAPVVMDAENTLVTLGVGVGLVANPAGATAALAGLPAGIATFLALPKL